MLKQEIGENFKSVYVAAFGVDKGKGYWSLLLTWLHHNYLLVSQRYLEKCYGHFFCWYKFSLQNSFFASKMGKSWSWVIKISESHGKHTRNLFWKLGVHWANLGVDMRKFWICSYFCPNQVWSYFSWKFAEYHSWLTLYQKLNHFEPISGQISE